MIFYLHYDKSTSHRHFKSYEVKLKITFNFKSFLLSQEKKIVIRFSVKIEKSNLIQLKSACIDAHNQSRL